LAVTLVSAPEERPLANTDVESMRLVPLPVTVFTLLSAPHGYRFWNPLPLFSKHQADSLWCGFSWVFDVLCFVLVVVTTRLFSPSDAGKKGFPRPPSFIPLLFRTGVPPPPTGCSQVGLGRERLSLSEIFYFWK